MLLVPELLHAQLADDIAASGGVVMLLGAPDTGKTTLAHQIMAAGVKAGLSIAYVDADVGQSTVGPPSCVGLRWINSTEDLSDLSQADELRFVGSTSPERLVLQQVLATATLVDIGRRTADLVVIDTTGAISGVVGQTLKFHKMELCRPDLVIALQRGAEMEPIIGMLRRFFAARVEALPVHPDVTPVSPDVQSARRQQGFAAAFENPLEKWRVRPTVFAPTISAGLDFARLDGMLVGIQDGEGRCLGLGALEYDEGVLRVITNCGEGMQGLRLGSLRMNLQDHQVQRVNLREVMYGLDR
ncbi:MAG: Clp1/GlmU family protein [Acidimicrobiia bacterium]|nr:Clp1/GlmU family protein [Acidimicrobiia bacterium]